MMLDQSFCGLLEVKICQAFKTCDTSEAKGFWCDGVLLSEPAKYYSKKYVSDNRVITLKAFVGKDGQTEYRLLLKLGNSALSKFARGLDILECFPAVFNTSNFFVDVRKHEIEIRLD